MLLTEDAADWAESHPDAIRMLADPDPTQATVDDFKALFCERFPSKIVETTPVAFDVELSDLHQKPDESLSTYYGRVTSLMRRIGAKDRPASTPSSTPFTLLESAMLDTILRSFIRGLNDPEIRKEATRGMAPSDRSLRNIYNLAEEARRTNLEIQKLLDEEAKTDELRFYKSLVQKNLPQQQVASLLASYHATRAPQDQSQQSQYHWSFHSDPPQQVPQAPASRDLPKASAGSQRFPQPQSQDRRPSYESEAPRVLSQNTNRANVGRGGSTNTNPNPSSRFRNYQPTPKEMPDRTTSKNPYINGTLTWFIRNDGQLCVKCGKKGHGSPSCDAPPLPAWEQSYLRMIVFGDNPQSNFATVGFGEYDGSVRPYGTTLQEASAASSTASSNRVTPSGTSSSSMDSYLSPRLNSVQFGVAGLSQFHSADVHAAQAEAFYGEGSAPNKRPHDGEEAESSNRAGPSQRQREKQPERRPQAQEPRQIQAPEQAAAPAPVPIQAPQQPAAPAPVQVPQAPQPMPQAPQQQQAPVPTQAPAVPQQNTVPQQPFQFQAASEEEERPKRKGKKRVGKKAEPQPLVGMINERGGFDPPVSIRYLLQSTKVNMALMDLFALSPTACKELKRLCTRVAKKRLPKASQPQAPVQQPAAQQQHPVAPQQQQQQGGVPQFNFQPSQQFPQPVPTHMMPDQASQPTMSGALQDPQIDLNLPAGSQSQQSSQQTLGNQSFSIPSYNISALGVEAERHTIFLSSLIGVDKAFRLSSTVRKPDGSEIKIDKKQTQADQGSDMNVLSSGMVRFLGLPTFLLADIGFKGLSMRTADHRDTILKYWVWLNIGVEGVWRNIRCFVAPEVVSVTESGRSEYLSLILGIPWLFSVDASISIRMSTIFIGDRSIGEQVRGVVGPELVFCKDHNLLMYPKSAMVASDTVPKATQKATVEEVDDSTDSEDSDSDSEEDIEEVERKDFQ